mmetsp:Transcript_79391/g.219577  ORF Transcript_79391/g.219577 Transcript_79391/m.219577 type:complete len:258 (+) Transcript_79391:42-815(+)
MEPGRKTTPRRATAQLPPLLASLASRRAQAASTDTATAETGSESRRVHRGDAGTGTAAAPKRRAKVQKGAPMEVSSRRPVAPPRTARRKAAEPRDPRFDDFSGSLDVDSFQKSYSFLEEYREAELDGLKKKVDTLKKRRKELESEEGATLEPDAAALEENLSTEMRRRIQQDKQRRHLGELRAAEVALKNEEREKVRKTGKMPYFHKRGAVRKMVQEKKKQEKKGSRSKQVERRERKAAAREKRKLPQRRRRNDSEE